MERAFIAGSLRCVDVEAGAAVSIGRKLLKQQQESCFEAVVRERPWFGESKRVAFWSRKPSREETIET